MMDFVDHMMFVCFAGAAISFIFLVIGGIFEAIDYFTKGKFSDSIVNFFSEESDE